MYIYRSKRTGFHAFVTGSAILLVQLHNAINPSQGIRGTYLRTCGYFTLAAHNRHSHDRMRVCGQDSYRRLLGIVHSEMFDCTYKFTDPATGTLLRDYR